MLSKPFMIHRINYGLTILRKYSPSLCTLQQIMKFQFGAVFSPRSSQGKPMEPANGAAL